MLKPTFKASIILFLTALFASHAFAGVFFSVNIAPPVIPVYAQPACPGDGYIWTPGYWAYGDSGYYWVPGTWVFAPRPGFLWTPGYWGSGGGMYLWHAGYWGPHVGYYGGVNYGYGYFGSGFAGGRWEGGAFQYNRAVTNVNVTNIHNTYVDHTVVREVTNNNSGSNFRQGQPQHREVASAHVSHAAAVAAHNPHQEAPHRENHAGGRNPHSQRQ